MIFSSAPPDLTDDIAIAAMAENAFTSEGGRLDPGTASSEEEIEARLREMAELAISHVGRFYRFRGYQYDRLEDAVAYARLVRSHVLSESQEDRDTLIYGAGREEPPPDAAARETMAALGISYVGGLYCFEDFRYERRADALQYALQQQRR